MVCLLLSCLAAGPAFAGRPNVLMIAVDDLACTLGCYGDLIAKTPHIDSLAASGTCFRRAYNQLPLCNPTRASLMTGLRPDQIGVYDLDRHFRDACPDVITLPQLFRRSGYSVTRVGKLYHYNVPAGIGTNGLDDPDSWDKVINPVGRDKADEHLVFNAEPHRKISAALSWLAAEGSGDEQTDGLSATAAIDIMRKAGNKPFFLAVGFFRPHTPYIAPKDCFERYSLDEMRIPYTPPGDRDDVPTAAFAHNCPVPHYGLDSLTLRRAMLAYYASVSFVDDQVGRLLTAVETLGLGNNTIVCFWSDHGYHLGEHGGVWQKRTLFEQAARAPLIVRLPGIQPATAACDRVVEFVDVYPTIVQAAGLAMPNEWKSAARPSESARYQRDGSSLIPLMHAGDAPWIDEAITQILRPKDDRLSAPVMGRSVRTKRWRFTQWAEGGCGEELYDHQTDPGEFDNLMISALDDDGLLPHALQSVVQELRGRFQGRAIGTVPDAPFNPPRL
ncbi:MAG: sulfatase [Planctomycetota bacterium]